MNAAGKHNQPYPWEQRKLGEIAEEVKGNSGSINNIPILTISAANGWMNQKDRFSQIIAGNELKKYTLLKKGELSYNHGNSKLAKYGTVFVQDSHDQALVPRVYHSFKMVAQNNPYFIEYLFASGLPNKELSKIVTSGARMDGLLNINKKEFFSIKLNNPSSEEQSRIAKLFQFLDKTITLHEEKQRQLEQLKKALLQKMFADKTGYPALRFKDFTEKWEQRKLGEIASMHARIGWQGLKTSEFLETGDYYLITGTDFENGHVNLEKAHYIDKSRYDMDQKLKLKNGDILITKDGTIGKVAYLENLDKPGTLNAGVFIVRPIKKSVYKQYLFQYLAAPFLLKYAKSHSTGGTIQHLNQGIIKNFPVALPSTEEQLVISKFLKYISKTITLHDKKIQYLKQLKRGLLQKMFV